MLLINIGGHLTLLENASYNWRSAGPPSLASCLRRTRSAVLSLEERRTEVRRLLHNFLGYRPCATGVVTNRRPLASHCGSGRRWRGKTTHSVEMPSEERQGYGSMGSDATLQNVGEIQARLQFGKVHRLKTTPFIR